MKSEDFKNILIIFMIKKAEILDNPEYFTIEDEKDIIKWEDEDAEDVFYDIDNSINDNLISDGSICPFCSYQNKDSQIKENKIGGCLYCQYGERHGVCGNKYSLYFKIIEKIKEDYPNKFISSYIKMKCGSVKQLWEETINEIINK